jgi:hypothetical protein
MVDEAPQSNKPITAKLRLNRLFRSFFSDTANFSICGAQFNRVQISVHKVLVRWRLRAIARTGYRWPVTGKMGKKAARTG